MEREYIELKLKTNPKEGILSVRSRRQDNFLFVMHTTAQIFEDSMTHT